MGESLGHVLDRRALAPVHLGRGAEPKRRLIMDVHAIWDVRVRHDVDVICRVRLRGLDRRRLVKARIALPVAIDGLVDPVAYRHLGPCVRVRCVDVGLGLGFGCGTGDAGERQQRDGSELHGGGFGKEG